MSDETEKDAPSLYDLTASIRQSQNSLSSLLSNKRTLSTAELNISVGSFNIKLGSGDNDEAVSLICTGARLYLDRRIRSARLVIADLAKQIEAVARQELADNEST